MKNDGIGYQDVSVRRSFELSSLWFLLAGILLCGTQNALCQSDSDLLRLVRDGHRANLEKIRSWKGEARVNHTGENWELCDKLNVDSEVDYAFDADKDAVRWNYKQTSDTRYVGGEAKQLSGVFSNKMIKDGKAFLLGPYRCPKDARPRYYVGIDSADNLRLEISAHDFHPMLYLADPTGQASPLFEILQFYAECAEKGEPGLKVSRNGNRVVLLREDAQHSTINRYTFDLSVGCNLVEYYGSDDSATTTWTMEYVKVGGAFVPSKQVYTNEQKTMSPHRKSRKAVEFLNTVVNEPLSPDEFSLERLGALPGDVIDDRIVGIRYSYKSPQTPLNLMEVIPANAIEPVSRVEATDVTPQNAAITTPQATERNTQETRVPLPVAAAPTLVREPHVAWWGLSFFLVLLACAGLRYVMVRRRPRA
jgi:hypothetical protein